MEYQVRATATDTGRQHAITTDSKQNAIRYAALFRTSADWKGIVIVTGGKEYQGQDIRSKMP